MSSVNELTIFAKAIQESVNCCLPARVVQVNQDGSVNVVAIRNDKIDDCVITIPVIRPETQRAYIYLGIKAGDRGIIKFMDKSIEEYRLTGSEAYNNDDRSHSLSDGIFQLGFLPDNEKFVYPEGEIVIDSTGKVRGHGAYVCKDIKVIELAQKKKTLDRALETAVPREIYDELKKLV